MAEPQFIARPTVKEGGDVVLDQALDPPPTRPACSSPRDGAGSDTGKCPKRPEGRGGLLHHGCSHRLGSGQDQGEEKSFQELRKHRIAVAARPAPDSGGTILQKACQRPAPTDHRARVELPRQLDLDLDRGGRHVAGEVEGFDAVGEGEGVGDQRRHVDLA